MTAFWGALDERDRRRLKDAGAVVSPHRHLMRERAADGQVFVIMAGWVKVWAGPEVVLDVLGPGEIVGELEAVGDGTRLASVTALGKVTALAIGRVRFQRIVADLPAVGGALRSTLAGRLRDANELRIARRDGALPALILLLGRLAERHGLPRDGALLIPVPLAAQDVGRWAGVGRQWTARQLAGLGVRFVTGEGIVVSDPTVLT